jgi:hypothetical protein
VSLSVEANRVITSPQHFGQPVRVYRSMRSQVGIPDRRRIYELGINPVFWTDDGKPKEQGIRRADPG